MANEVISPLCVYCKHTIVIGEPGYRKDLIHPDEYAHDECIQMEEGR